MSFYIVVLNNRRGLKGHRYVCVKNNVRYLHRSAKHLEVFASMEYAEQAAIPYRGSWEVNIHDLENPKCRFG